MELIKSEALWRKFLERNGYGVCEIIGCGGFGDVYSALCLNDGTKYAIKRLVSRRDIMTDDIVMREIKALMELQHPCIISMKEILLSDTVACIVMELASKGNLEMVAENSKLSEFFAVTTFHQITRAIEYCHSCGIAHRDINPSNILVFDTGKVKLTDFGLCFQCKGEANGNDLLCCEYLGQEVYLAPEVREQKPYHPIPADIWSLGCVLSFIVSKAYPQPKEHSSNSDSDFNIPFEDNDNLLNDVTNPSSSSELNATPDDLFPTNIFIFTAQLKRIEPFKRPTATQVLQRWTKKGGDLSK